jgi:hypothetical protein
VCRPGFPVARAQVPGNAAARRSPPPVAHRLRSDVVMSDGWTLIAFLLIIGANVLILWSLD